MNYFKFEARTWTLLTLFCLATYALMNQSWNSVKKLENYQLGMNVYLPPM